MVQTKLDHIRLQLEAQQADLRGRLGPSGDGSGSGADGADRLRRTALHHRLTNILEQVETALTRLDSGQYGTCIQCGQPIREERLEILPYAVYCVRCSAAQGRRS